MKLSTSLRGFYSSSIQILSILALTGCGSADFAGVLSGKADKPEPAHDGSGDAAGGTLEEEELKQLNISWSFPCDEINQEGKISAKSDDEKRLDSLDVSGGGKFTWDLQDYESIHFSSSGSLCKSTQKPRDILFIVDVSGSMDADPITNDGHCHRSRALNKILDVLAPLGHNRFAALTFSDTLIDSSGNFYDSKDGFFQSLGTNPIQKLCADLGGTNFGAAFTAAETFLPKVRRNADAEIYFISDGAPSSDNGVIQADRLKFQGSVISGLIKTARISSIMIGSNNGHMRMIASKKIDGNPYYIEAANFQDLETQLLNLTNPGIKSFSLSYRLNGETSWTEFKTKNSKDDFSFSINDMKFKQDKDRFEELWVKLEYTDNQDRHYQVTGYLGKGKDVNDSAMAWTQIPAVIEVESAMTSRGDYLDYSVGNSNDKEAEYDIDIAAHAVPLSESNTHFINNIFPSEWIRFPIEVPEDGLFDITASIAAGEDSRVRGLHFEINSEILSGAAGQSSIVVMQGSGLTTWKPYSVKKVPLKKGRHFLDIMMDTYGFYLDKIEISASQP